VQIDLDTLPDDPAILRQMLRDVVTTAAHPQGELHAENDKLRLLIQRLLRNQFGRRSEQLSPDQLQFGLEDLEQTVAENQAGQDVANPAPDRPVDGGMPTEALVAHVVVSTVLSSPKVFADDTTLPVLDPGRGRTKTGRLWCYAVDDRPWCGPRHPAAAYVYSEDRKNARPAGHLAGFRGVLYAIEAEIRGHPAEHRQQVRHERSRPIVDALHAWLQDHVGRVSAASDLAKAIRYAIRHWPGLVVFLDDGRVEIDTNVVERAIRPNTLTRKNALFAGSDGGARHWAIAMTLIQTAKLNGVDPMAWLTDVLERVVFGRTKAHELQTLLPWNWTAPRSSTTAALAA